MTLAEIKEKKITVFGKKLSYMSIAAAGLLLISVLLISTLIAGAITAIPFLPFMLAPALVIFVTFELYLDEFFLLLVVIDMTVLVLVTTH